MRTVNLIRRQTSDEGTFGDMLIVPEKIFYTAELPWRDNKPNISCLPTGTYLCEWDHSPKRGRNIYFIRENFNHRDAFQIHPGNYAGDVEKGFKSDALGCILLGNHFLDTGGQKMVSDSRLAVARFEALMDHEPFNLVITEEYNV